MRALLMALLLGGLFFASPALALKYPDEAHATVTTVTVHVLWVSDFEEADVICSALAGEPTKHEILACYFPLAATIVAVQPRNFNDTYHLSILGHEFWHALGAEHP